jgi:hypothetical protein
MWCPIIKAMCIDGWNEIMDKGKKKSEPSRKCRWWIGVTGKHPQSGVVEDKHDCAIAWQPTLALEVARVDFSLGGAVESLRNRVSDLGNGLGNLVQALPMLMSGSPLISVSSEKQEQLPPPSGVKTGDSN